MDDARPRRFQISIRTLMIACVAVAIFCVPIAWVAREREQMLRLQHEILVAREVALRSVVLEEEARKKQAVDRATSTSVEDLRRENAALRTQVEKLNQELGTLRRQSSVRNPAGPVFERHVR